MRAYYTADKAKFASDSDDHILGELTRHHHFALEMAQTGAWLQQIRILRNALAAIDDFTLYLEFAIPRMGRRADAVVVIGDGIFVIEFKVGSETFDRAAIDQVEDYALDLKNFHLGSHDRVVVPILVATRATQSRAQFTMALDQVATPLLATVIDLGDILRMAAAQHRGRTLDVAAWASSGYRPTPTIIQAATALYARHGVEDITRRDADAINLTRTEDAITAIIEDCRHNNRKAVCFITGVPGAGKTLAGLNIATRRSERTDGEHATFLSGNGPLVDVLREALVRDHRQRNREAGASSTARRVEAFIQNIHHFRDEYLRSSDAPSDHVVIFDEAQRAWTRAQASAFMQRKRAVPDFDMSEPEFLLGVMDRHADWCTVICLVGGGQEINTGEAGLSEWMAAIRDRFSHWQVHASAAIDQPDYDLNGDARTFIASRQVKLGDSLHLAVSMRSFRAESLSAFVAHLLDGDTNAARQAMAALDHYPIVVTRELSAARQWLRDQARGSERFGLVASSGAHRLKPEGLNLRAAIDPPNWFLNGRDDVRSSFYLEDAASEFDVQGLELDWVGVCWDADWRHNNDAWQAYSFKGTRWQSVNDRFRRLYLKNAYRVILTRARQGMVIFVPKGDAADPTRPPSYYDGTYEFLRDCGLRPIY